ncbi:MAG TPA: phosphoglycerate dehydrogenase, partial [Acidobacteriota bacterium]|nr:phosphoglycerate dehydrogenase [Acidobacteriota bacterium]
MKIIVTERIAEEGIQYLRSNGFDVDVRYGISQVELLDVIADYDAIVVRSVTRVNGELLEKAANLKVAGRAGNGIDNIDVEACTEKGILVVNTPESNTMAAAELAIALAYCLFRNVPQANHACKNMDFRRNRYIGRELDGKTVGIIGLGRIGSIVARKLIGANMKAIAYDPYITDEKFTRNSVDKCETLDELLERSDLVTIHTPKTAETYGMVGEKQLRLCKKGVYIVNAARGGLIEEKALFAAIKSGHVAGAGIDVLDPEPGYDKSPEQQTYRNPLLELDNVIVTPHLGASTEEANYNVGTAITKLVADALNGQMVAAVNMPSLKSGDLLQLKPYITLAEMLGKIYYQIEKETVEKLEVICCGDLIDMETRMISLSALKGLLYPIVRETVNYVNAERIAKNMGIELI